jgi:superfamily II DNA or RNA helicase
MSGSSLVNLHGFQRDAIDQIECEIARGVRRVLYVAPTGSGKTVVAAEITRRAADRCQRVLFLAHRREIIDQTSRKLAANGIPLGLHGIVLAGRERDLRPQAMVQVASIDTLLARGIRSETMRLPPADIIIFDESHRIRGRTREYLVSLYPDAVLLGLTATPCRGDGRGLGNIFETMIQAPQVAELIGLGFLVGARVFAPVDKDIAKGVRTEKGDYVVSALSARMNTTELVGDVVRDWLQHGERRRTVAFAVDVAHSVHIRDEFVRAGVRAEHLDGSTRLAEREAILARLGSGKTEVVSNCMVLTEGWDMPEVGCCILARPTKQLGLYRQMIGRVRLARRMRSSSITPGPGIATGYPRITSSGRLRLTRAPRTALTRLASAAKRRHYASVPPASRSWLRHRRASIADGSHDRVDARSISSTASLDWSAAAGPWRQRIPSRTSAAGTGSWSRSPARWGRNPVGHTTSISKSSAKSRSGIGKASKASRRPRCAATCVRARSPSQSRGGRHDIR